MPSKSSPSGQCSSESDSRKSASGHTRVYLADDHPAIREALRDAIGEAKDMEACGASSSVEEALQEIGRLGPDVAVVDISLKDGHGLTLLRQIQEQWPEVEVVVYSMYDEEAYAERAVSAGASGYLMKSEPPERLVLAIRRVADGRFYLSRRMYARVLDGLVEGGSRPEFPIDQLTGRERQVPQMIGEGLGVREIADRLDLTKKTAETHRRRVKEKLGFDSIDELLQYATKGPLERIQDSNK